MLKERIRELFRKYDSDIQELVEAVLDSEQQYISYELRTRSKKLQEIKETIRQTIDRMVVNHET